MPSSSVWLPRGERTMSDELIEKYVKELRTAAWVRQLPKDRTAALVDAYLIVSPRVTRSPA